VVPPKRQRSSSDLCWPVSSAWTRCTRSRPARPLLMDVHVV
jgi:hypothetical protein